MEGGFCPVAEQGRDYEQVFAGAAVDHRIGAAGIVADHSSDHGAVGGGCLGSEQQAIGPEKEVEFIPDHTGLHTDPSLLRIQFQDLREVLGDVYDDPLSNNLSGEGGSGGAGDEGSLFRVGKFDQLFDVGDRPGNGNG